MYNDLEKVVRYDLPGIFNEFDLLKKHFSRIINVFEGNILPPYEILIHTSSVCNLNCEWCIGGFVANKNNQEGLLKNNLFDINNMKKLVDGILKYKKKGYNYQTNSETTFQVENISFSGITGEPFMAKESILYAIDRLSKEGIRVGAFTNGTLITEDIFDTVLKMSYVLISLDAGTKKTYSRLKTMNKELNTFDNLILTIQKLNERKKEVKSKLDINIGYVINQYNYNEIYDIAKVLKESGVHYLRFKTDIASIMNLSFSQRKLAKQQIEKVRKDLQDDYFSVVEIHNVNKDREKERHFNKCFIHYLVGNISADGNVYPCNYHPKPNGYYYDSAITNSFESVWEDIINSKIDKQIPDICPKVCDPFKNRANKLLEMAYNIYKEKGLDYLKECINYIDNKIKKESH